MFTTPDQAVEPQGRRPRDRDKPFGVTPDGTPVDPAQAGSGGYPINILDEDALGGHTNERHVGKSEEYLKARVLSSRRSVPPIFSVGERRAGSFTSLEAANKLVNSTLSDNSKELEAFAKGGFSHVLPFKFVFRDFDSATGYEAFAPNERSQPVIRPTYGVTVFVRRTARSPKGYFVESAWPTNRD